MQNKKSIVLLSYLACHSFCHEYKLPRCRRAVRVMCGFDVSGDPKENYSPVMATHFVNIAAFLRNVPLLYAFTSDEMCGRLLEHTLLIDKCLSC